ncbi:helix-turn-helix domain-containing protein [Pseudomonas fluorescens]|jgi:hypothetical protein|uniref:helix-turn-helix domain-containing protein n=2 Tax=Pseudomonas TaxID=286 RepID=UPI000F49B201|nr:helix-turn-helix transcriptional regulator [Pseudomonas koreensis]MDE1910092.1 helix-turn-helix transcriptional regulator [Pseudomonas sp.]MDE2037570.1 helix-turn-helix transcriptional regulator [Pseudomonas sp.]MDE2193345.1 helix-turn-helix transcriptional regulator [Pseudomonas sp.]RON93052.1 hypothetical protein BK668_04005 [Pseudomonas fluorescens]
MQICYYFNMNCIKPPQLLQLELRQFFERGKITSSSAIARMTGISQSQIYRNLYGRPKRVTSTLKALCDYANISIFAEKADPRNSPILMDALGLVWDGTDQHAKRLAELLFAHRKACL